MIESELNSVVSKEVFPEIIVKQFRSVQEAIEKRSVLHWAEHCVECAVPECYQSCELYEARIDGKCRRFVHGIELVEAEPTEYLKKIQFKQWAKLETQGNHKMFSENKKNRIEQQNYNLDRVLSYVFLNPLKGRLIRKRYHQKKSWVKNLEKHGSDKPEFFLIEIYNPEMHSAVFTLEIRSENIKHSKIPFQYRFEIESGYSKQEIPFEEIEKRINLNSPYTIAIIPEDVDPDHVLYFGVIDFVCVSSNQTIEIPSADKKIKCVVWDLDNTIWNGVLIEDGLDKLTLKCNIEMILNTIEQRGIINSIASKNNLEPAIDALIHFGLEEYFIHNQIGWKPKSTSVKAISASLNINLNSILFVDDSSFELEEVSVTLPSVRTINALEYENVLDLPALDVPITAESKERKKFYLRQQVRNNIESDFEGEYFDFLRQCNLELILNELQPKHFKRVYELAQRTNQMNFTGIRYSISDIERICKDENLLSHVLSCRDKYGEYGVIGFAITNVQENRLEDLMFSCRIQSKRVEHAYITYLLRYCLGNGDFKIRYKPTQKNRFSAQVFLEFDFEPLRQSSDEVDMIFRHGREIPDDDVVKIVDNT